MAKIMAVEPAKAAEQAHTEIWRRFIDEHGIMIDFADMEGKVSLPMPEECKTGKPNALGHTQKTLTNRCYKELRRSNPERDAFHTVFVVEKRGHRSLF